MARLNGKAHPTGSDPAGSDPAGADPKGKTNGTEKPVQASGKLTIPARRQVKTAGEAGTTSILLATPSYRDSFCSDYVNSLMALSRWTQHQGIGLRTHFFNYADIAATRNILLTQFWHGPAQATHLLFVDDDMGFPRQLVTDALALDEDVVGAFYSKRQVDLAKLHAAGGVGFETAKARAAGFVGKQARVSQTRGRFVTADYVGTGFMLIRRSAIARLIEAQPKLVSPNRYNGVFGDQKHPSWITAFDRIRIKGVEYSEDYAFCLRWRQAGGQIWAARDAVLPHNGQIRVTARHDAL